MLSKRIIPCLDVKNGLVVKRFQFKNYKIIGNILSLSNRYIKEGADELFFYDISSSIKNTLVNKNWISMVSEIINIPFCVGGGIKNFQDAKKVLCYGADKVSINSYAIKNPYLISEIAEKFGVQSVVVGIDSFYCPKEKKYFVNKYIRDKNFIKKTDLETCFWVEKVQKLGAGEIVLNSIDQYGMKNGYDLKQLCEIRNICKVPLIASGGAGNINHFYDVFKFSNVDGSLASSVFHEKIIYIPYLKKILFSKNIEIRKC
ncbi:MAG: imidazole glycerol phosphate synthase subunit HisF [Buchnera aphidicola (Periphyllus lyropictus)]|uniref:imidazole glycerol phosphate synthase subunit HisF n=1 Tax=Buchnera aphidicola TaxID=9 RepID=UPI001ED62613|nr:HisA/HisF-related TIM barrel protein [Buchnera aphidicola]NIH16726.1 imidazole glycerol phosphate synthase subunit HisF [Buchnera aphidicola (Periphyllus lyropictus)]USS94630.1 imidazole glycerol phosphate synthase cyclase subunit [Buchnera aphidicola (Periphyllus lyropictus)]